MPPKTDRDVIIFAGNKRGWTIEDQGPDRVLFIKAQRVVSVNFDPDRTGRVVSAFDGTKAIKGRMPGAVLAVLNRG
jgi:hypothetical protein